MDQIFAPKSSGTNDGVKGPGWLSAGMQYIDEIVEDTND